MEFIVVALIVLVLARIVVAVASYANRLDSEWAAAAEELGLDHQPSRLTSGSRISGRLTGLDITVETATSDESEGNVTRYRVRYPRPGFTLHMSRETVATRALAMLGRTDVQTGDPEFDAAFAVKTSHPDRLQAILTDQTRRLLVDLVEDYRSVKITDEHVTYEKPGTDRSRSDVVTTTRRLIEVARALAPARSTAPGGKVRGRTPEPVVPLSATSTEPRTPEPLAEPSIPMRPEPAAVEAPDAERVARDLFATRGLSFQIADRFDKQYRGGRVTWTGDVRRVHPATRPTDLSRLDIRVATVRHELFGSVEVLAVASIHERMQDLQQGTPVTVSGRLSDIDVTGRRLLLDHARVEVLRPEPHAEA